jgi:hypothetical protein
MHTYSAMTIASQRQAEDRRAAGAHALASRAGSPRMGLSMRRLVRLRGAVGPGRVAAAPQGDAVSAPQGTVRPWRLSH